MFTLNQFKNLIDIHEEIMEEILHLPTIKNKIFSDYNEVFVFRSMGIDFILHWK